MKREEEIKQAAAAYILELYGEENEDSDVAEGFRECAKWADENPNSNGKELLYVAQKTTERTRKEVINNALEFINEYFYEHPHCNCLICTESFESLEDFIDNFKKAMEL